MSSLRIQHKTDSGGVRLNLSNAQEVRQAFADLKAIADVDAVVIQPMVKGGLELTVGIAPDPVFGPVVGFGIGGVDVELVGDVRFRVALSPITTPTICCARYAARACCRVIAVAQAPTWTPFANCCCACPGWRKMCTRSRSSIFNPVIAFPGVRQSHRRRPNQRVKSAHKAPLGQFHE